jgi:S-DNA-T family DNA segregation ATPase FtsK/SpoIIIE
MGDMLFLIPGTSHLIRAQGTYASDNEINGVVQFLESYEPQYSRELVQLPTTSGDKSGAAGDSLKDRDELYEQAVEIIVREGRGSVSLLQRAMGIGYGRAARLIDYMAEDGIVGDYNGAQAREVLFTPEEWQQMRQGQKQAG